MEQLTLICWFLGITISKDFIGMFLIMFHYRLMFLLNEHVECAPTFVLFEICLPINKLVTADELKQTLTSTFPATLFM